MNTPMTAHQSSPDTAAVPDISMYRYLHQAMRTADAMLVIGIESLPLDDHNRAAALATWFDGYAGELRSHHHVEDAIFFPAVMQRSTDIPVDHLTGEHEELDRLIDALRDELRRLADETTANGAAQERAASLARELQVLLTGHLDVEDNDLLPLFERLFTKAEYDELDHRAIKTVPFEQLTFTVPWLMATLDPADAEHLRATAKLAMRLLWRATRRRHDRLVRRAFGDESSIYVEARARTKAAGLR